MLLLDKICEQNIQQAQRDGVFEDLPGMHQALVLEDDTMIPEEIRVAYRLMKNSGFLPPEISMRKEISDIDNLIAQSITFHERESLQRKKNTLLIRLRAINPNSSLLNEQEYYLKFSQNKG